jgi:hypothetical protein
MGTLDKNVLKHIPFPPIPPNLEGLKNGLKSLNSQIRE